MAKCSARCSLAPSMFHHATLVSRSFLFPYASPTSKANIPLIPRRRSIMENILCGIRRPGICVLLQTTCRLHITMCAAKHDVRFTIFWACVNADHVCHRMTAGQVQQRCRIALQHRLPTWSGWISRRVTCILSTLDLANGQIHTRGIPKPKLPCTTFCVLWGEWAYAVVRFIRETVFVHCLS